MMMMKIMVGVKPSGNLLPNIGKLLLVLGVQLTKVVADLLIFNHQLTIFCVINIIFIIIIFIIVVIT